MVILVILTYLFKIGKNRLNGYKLASLEILVSDPMLTYSNLQQVITPMGGLGNDTGKYILGGMQHPWHIVGILVALTNLPITGLNR